MAPTEESSDQTACSVHVGPENIYALLNASILSPARPQFRPPHILLMLHLAAFCWELCHCLDWVSYPYQSS